jgi:hypothetical protein
VSAKRILAHDPSLLSEAEWSGLVVECARLGGWTLRYHTFVSRRSAHGFPDWFFWHPGVTRHSDDGYLQPMILVAELKTEAGRVSEKQQAWLDALRLSEEAAGYFYTAAHGAGKANYDDPHTYWYPFRVRLWRPSNWDDVVETLTRKKPKAARAA